MDLAEILNLISSIGTTGVCGVAAYMLWRSREADRLAFEAKCQSCPVRAQRDRVFDLIIKRIERNGGTHAEISEAAGKD